MHFSFSPDRPYKVTRSGGCYINSVFLCRGERTRTTTMGAPITVRVSEIDRRIVAQKESRRISKSCSANRRESRFLFVEVFRSTRKSRIGPVPRRSSCREDEGKTRYLVADRRRTRAPTAATSKRVCTRVCILSLPRVSTRPY